MAGDVPEEDEEEGISCAGTGFEDGVGLYG